MQLPGAIPKSGDAGLALNKAILSKNNPLADVFYGVDNTFWGAPWRPTSSNPTTRPHWPASPPT